MRDAAVIGARPLVVRLVVLSVLLCAGCTAASIHRGLHSPTSRAGSRSARTAVRAGPAGAADLLATPAGVVWSFHLKDGSGTLLRSSDNGKQWKVALPSDVRGYGFGLVASYFLNARRAWAVQENEHGTTIVHRTSDGARTWQLATLPGISAVQSPMFDQIGFTSPTDGWLLAVNYGNGTSDTLQLTAWGSHDGGASWKQLPSRALPLQGRRLAGYGRTACPTFAPPHLTMAAGGVGWLTPGGCEHGAAEPRVWRTSNNGSSWTPAALPAPVGGWGRWNVLGRGGTEVGPVSSRGVANAATLLVPVAVGAAGLVVERSENGGQSWQLAGEVDTRGAPTRTPVAELFDPIDTDNWVVSAAGGLVETTDAGRSWTFAGSGLDDPDQPISFTTPSRGFRGGVDLVAAQRTSDAGRSWAPASVPAAGMARVAWADGYPVQAITAINQRVVVAAGAAGLLLSHNGGASWARRLTATTPVEQLDAVDARTVFAVTGDQLLRSTDAGRRWTPIRQPDAGPAQRVQFWSPSTGIATLAEQAFRTRDAGRTWTPLRLPPGWSLPDASLAEPMPGPLCFNHDAGWAVAMHAGQPGVLASSNGGRTWRQVLAPSTFPLARPGAGQVQIADCHRSTGWVLVTHNPKPVGMGSAPTGYALLRSTDLGRTWNEVLRSPQYAPRPHVQKPPAGPAPGPAGRPTGFTTTSTFAAWLTTATDNPAQGGSAFSLSTTTDTGLHWTTTRFPPHLAPTGTWLTTAAVDAEHGWVIFGGPKQSGTSLGFATIDAGRRWSSLPTFDWSR